MSDLKTYNDGLRLLTGAIQTFEDECDVLAGVGRFANKVERKGHANGSFSQAVAGFPSTLDYSTLSGLVLSGPGPTERADFGQLDPLLLIAIVEACPPLYQQLLDFDFDVAGILAAGAGLQAFIDELDEP